MTKITMMFKAYCKRHGLPVTDASYEAFLGCPIAELVEIEKEVQA